MTSVKLINHSSSTADWNYLQIFLFPQTVKLPVHLSEMFSIFVRLSNQHTY